MHTSGHHDPLAASVWYYCMIQRHHFGQSVRQHYYYVFSLDDYRSLASRLCVFPVSHFDTLLKYRQRLHQIQLTHYHSIPLKGTSTQGRHRRRRWCCWWHCLIRTQYRVASSSRTKFQREFPPTKTYTGSFFAFPLANFRTRSNFVHTFHCCC